MSWEAYEVEGTEFGGTVVVSARTETEAKRKAAKIYGAIKALTACLHPVRRLPDTAYLYEFGYVGSKFHY